MHGKGVAQLMSVDLSIARAVLRELPDALRPSWGARTWAGTFGSQSLRARVTAMDTVLELSVSGLSGTSKVRGEVLGARRGTGTFRQVLTLHDSGRLEAHHNVLKLPRGARGTGFGSGFVDQARARYAEAGIDDVTMAAGMSVGGYAWARQGLEFTTSRLDDAARTLDRGRQLAAIVDDACSSVSVSGRFPRFGRRITDAEHASLAPRLVRGDTLPPDALTSMRELAAIPDLGRKILLGRMWKGSADIERTSTWWSRNGDHAAAEAATGVSWRTQPQIVAGERVAAARRIAAQMPAAVDPYRASETFLRRLGHAAVDDASGGARAVLRVGLDDAAPHVTTRIPLRTPSVGALDLTITWDGARVVATESRAIRDWRDAGLRQALDAAWRELGVERVRSAWTGMSRSVA